MKSFFRMVPFTLLPLLVILSACGLRVVKGSGDIVKDERDVSGFNAVEFSGFGRLIVTQGGEETLSIEVDDNLLQYIHTDVVGGNLRIDFEDNIVLRPTDNSIIFRLGVIELRSIDVSGAGSFEIGDLVADGMDLTLSGAGKIKINSIEASSLKVVVSGTGSIDVSGTVDSQTIEINGLGDYNALDLESQEATLNISGAGDADLWVHDSLDVTISGAGSVSYYGNPEVSQSVSGLGSINRRGDR